MARAYIGRICRASHNHNRDSVGGTEENSAERQGRLYAVPGAESLALVILGE
jgi:hypothetical protein